MPKTVPSIADIGLEKYLDDNYAAAGGYEKFKELVHLHAPSTVIGRAFSVDRHTAARWRKLNEEIIHD